MTLEHEKIMIKSFSDIPKLSKRYTRIFRIALVAQERDVTGRFKTTCIRGVGYLSVDPKTYLEIKSDNEVCLSSVSAERYGIVNNVNDLQATLSEHYKSPKDHFVKDWKALRNYLEMECGRASHVFGYAELRPTHAQIMAARKGKTETKPKRKTATPKRKPVASQTTLPLRARKDTSKPQQRVTQKPYRPKKGTGQVSTGGGATKSIEKDMARAAKPVGRRISRKGKVYYEYRENRSDDSNGMSDYYGRMLPERIRKLKAENAYGVKYHGGELVTPEARKNKKVLSRVMLMKVVSRYERMHIHKQPIENLLYFDKYGNCISHSVGNQKSVSSDSYSGSSAIVVTHNHPSENGVYQVPHSADDIVVFLTQNTPIMRVCTNGVYFQYEKPFGEVYNIVKARNYAKAFNKIWEECIADTIHKIALKNKIFIKVSFPNHRLKLSFDNRLKLPSEEYSRMVYEANVEIVKRANTSDYVNAHLEFVKYLKKNGVNNVKFTKGEL